MGFVMLSFGRRLLKIFHPEGIPWPGTVLYNAISKTMVFQSHYELIAKDILRYNKEGSILDVGTGPAWLLVKLHKLSPKLYLTGLDISPSMVAKAQRNMANVGLADIIEIKVGKAKHMPFADNSFDTVVSTGSIHHWKKPMACLNEIYRILKHGGYALMYDLVSDTPADVLMEISSEFGKLRVMLFWMHSFEEPFHGIKDFERLARSTLFGEGRIRFVGALCCLILRKNNLLLDTT